MMFLRKYIMFLVVVLKVRGLVIHQDSLEIPREFALSYKDCTSKDDKECHLTVLSRESHDHVCVLKGYRIDSASSFHHGDVASIKHARNTKNFQRIHRH
jgi:hypothetical protein